MFRGFKKVIRVGGAVAVFFFVLFLITAPVAIAQEGYVPLAPIPGVSGPGTDLGSYLPNLYRLGIGLAAALAVIVLAWGGIRYMTSEVVSSKSAAIGMMRNAVGGLILALASFVLLSTINPDLVTLKLEIEETTFTAPPSGAAPVQAGLFEVQKLLEDEIAMIKRTHATSPTIFKRCYLVYEQAVNQEKLLLDEFITIVRGTELPRATGDVNYSLLIGEVNDKSIATLFWDEESGWKRIGRGVGALNFERFEDLPNNIRQTRNTRIRNSLRNYIDTDIAGFFNHPSFSELTDYQKDEVLKRNKKSALDLLTVAEALRGGTDAIVNEWENYTFCSDGDVFAGSLNPPDPETSNPGGSLISAREDLTDEFNTVVTKKEEFRSDMRANPDNVYRWSCLDIYDDLVAVELKAVTDIIDIVQSGTMTVTERNTKINEKKAEALSANERRVNINIAGYNLTQPQLDRLVLRATGSNKTDLTILAPTPCAPDNQAGCGGTGSSQSISASYDPDLCENL